MSGNTITHKITAAAEQIGATRGATHGPSLAPNRAARELGLRRSEFDLAVHLGRIRTVPDEGRRGGRRVARDEIERIRAGRASPRR